MGGSWYFQSNLYISLHLQLMLILVGKMPITWPLENKRAIPFVHQSQLGPVTNKLKQSAVTNTSCLISCSFTMHPQRVRYSISAFCGGPCGVLAPFRARHDLWCQHTIGNIYHHRMTSTLVSMSKNQPQADIEVRSSLFHIIFPCLTYCCCIGCIGYSSYARFT